MDNPHPKITLCMIVKDEHHCIERCLESVYPYIDRYDITDTGSTDGTQDIIKNFFDAKGIPGEVHQSDWKGFGDHAGNMGSRTESLLNAEKSGAQYAWVIDADDSVVGEFAWPEEMNEHSYSLKIHRGDFTWWRNQVFKLGMGWKYAGILHEYAHCVAPEGEQITTMRIDGNYHIEARTEGNRNVGIDPIQKYTKDAEVLEKAIQDEPDNHRYWFYLGQSYFDSQQWVKASEAYAKRAELGGWEEEAFYALFRVAICSSLLNEPLDVQAHKYMQAYDYRPIRAEPLHQLSRMYRMNNMPRAAYLYAKQACSLPYPHGDILFLADEVYKWQALDELGATAFYCHDYETGFYVMEKLVSERHYPDSEHTRMLENHRQYSVKVQEIYREREEQQRRIEQEKQEKKEKEIRKKNSYKKRKGKKK